MCIQLQWKHASLAESMYVFMYVCVADISIPYVQASLYTHDEMAWLDREGSEESCFGFLHYGREKTI